MGERHERDSGTISATDSLVGSLSGDGVGGGGENLPYGNFATVGGVTASRTAITSWSAPYGTRATGR